MVAVHLRRFKDQLSKLNIWVHQLLILHINLNLFLLQSKKNVLAFSINLNLFACKTKKYFSFILHLY